MARKKLSKRNKMKMKDMAQKVIRIIFSVLIVGLAGYTVIQSYGEADNGQQSDFVTTEHQAFIDRIAPVAIKMQELYGVRPSVSMAQAVLESNFGSSELAVKYNNLYGVKTSDLSQAVLMETQEFTGSEWITISDYFKVYDSFASSIEDHAQLMIEGTDWNEELYHPVLKAETYHDAARALQQAGYATDPDYPEKIIQIIELYELYKFDSPNP